MELSNVSEAIADYRDVLLRHFELKRAKRASYSLRMFARDLELTPSNLSDVLKGRCGISAIVASRIAQILKMNTEEAIYFADLVESKHARSRADREAALERVRKHTLNPFSRKAKPETIPLFEKWYYVATLEFLTLKNGEPSVDAIADALGISTDEVHEALSRLLVSGAIRREGERFVRTENYLFADSPVPSATIRSFHKQVLDLGKDAIDQQAIDQRKFLSTLFTFDSRRLAEAIAYLENLDQDFFTKFESKEDSDSVYAFSLQLFRVDEKQKGLTS